MNILVLHGPNLNLLGLREPKIYGRQTLAQLNARIRKEAARLKLRLRIRQRNGEGQLIDLIQKNRGWADGILINPAAYTHYSYAIHDALKAVALPAVEAHLSDIRKRESWRKRSVIRPAVKAQVSGKGVESYLEGLRRLKALIQGKVEYGVNPLIRFVAACSLALSVPQPLRAAGGPKSVKPAFSITNVFMRPIRASLGQLGGFLSKSLAFGRSEAPQPAITRADAPISVLDDRQAIAHLQDEPELAQAVYAAVVAGSKPKKTDSKNLEGLVGRFGEAGVAKILALGTAAGLNGDIPAGSDARSHTAGASAAGRILAQAAPMRELFDGSAAALYLENFAPKDAVAPPIDGIVPGEDLGSGSQSTVHKAMLEVGTPRRRLSQVIALKRSLRAEPSDALHWEKQQGRSRREFNALRLIHASGHPGARHVVEPVFFVSAKNTLHIGPHTLVRFGQRRDLLLGMEYAPNGTLKAAIHQAILSAYASNEEPALALSPSQVARLTHQTALALEAAHSQGFVHRDVKPGNIFFDRNWNVKLGDFGVAGTLGQVSEWEQDSIVGSAPYMSFDARHEDSPQAGRDVYALAITMQEALAASVLGRDMNALQEDEYAMKGDSVQTFTRFHFPIHEILSHVQTQEPLRSLSSEEADILWELSEILFFYQEILHPDSELFRAKGEPTITAIKTDLEQIGLLDLGS